MAIDWSDIRGKSRTGGAGATVASPGESSTPSGSSTRLYSELYTDLDLIGVPITKWADRSTVIPAKSRLSNLRITSLDLIGLPGFNYTNSQSPNPPTAVCGNNNAVAGEAIAGCAIAGTGGSIRGGGISKGRLIPPSYPSKPKIKYAKAPKLPPKLETSTDLEAYIAALELSLEGQVLDRSRMLAEARIRARIEIEKTIREDDEMIILMLSI